MAATVRKAGLCPIKIQLPSGALELVGYTRGGADVTENGYYTEVPGDENGGDEGPPIEIQYFGETALIRIELTKQDMTVLNKVRTRTVGGTLGTPGASGTLMFADGHAFRLLLHAPNDPRNFPRTICRGAIESNVGTKWQGWTLEFEAFKDASGILFDATTA